MVNIIMFTGDTCGKCKGAKTNLGFLPPDAKEKMNLIEINVDQDEKHKEFMVNVLKSASLPSFMIEDTQGSIEYEGKMYESYIGFEQAFGTIQEVLGL